MSKVLGLDIGANSIGWALIDEGAERIIDMGVRIFQAGVNDLDQTKELSKNAARCDARGKRKQLDRKARRKRKLMYYLEEFGFLGGMSRDEFMKIDPYRSRKNGVNGEISVAEMARALYHICQRRGFKSSRKAMTEEESSGTIEKGSKDGKRGTNELTEAVGKNGFKTIGEYFASLDPHVVRIRNRYTLRRLYEQEFDLLWDTQQKYHPAELTGERRDIIKNEVIFFQRPLKSQKKMVGKCIFEKKKQRANRSRMEFQEFRMLQQVNQLTIKTDDRITDEQMKLTGQERHKLIDYLTNNKELKIDKPDTLKKVIGIDKKAYCEINLKQLGKLNGCDTRIKLVKIFGQKFHTFSEEELNQIWNSLNFFDDKDMLKAYAIKKWGLDDEKAEEFSKTHLEKDYGSLSLHAIKKILPYLREGDLYHDACLKAGYQHSLWDEKPEMLEKLPEPNFVANPRVMVAMHQVKKIVNAVMERYGRPDRITVEMTRNLKMGLDRRLKIAGDNKKIEEYHNRIKAELVNYGIEYPSRTDIIKYKLWEECNHIDPYTGMEISMDALFGPAPEFDIEHTYPYSRTLDDSYMNKTLCHRSTNHEKGNRTPYEAFSGDKTRYDAILERAKSLPFPKYRRFLTKQIEGLDEFISRQLNDTAYIARLATDYLRHVSPAVNIGNGKATSYLRKLWGFNSLLKSDEEEDGNAKKHRDDHRHHAVDAVVIALTTKSVLQRLSTYYRIGGSMESIKEQKDRRFDMPWKTLRSETEAKLKCLIVSHRKSGRVRGQFHDETNYGKIHDRDGQPMLNENGVPCYAVRKSLSALTPKEISNIIDPAVKELVYKRLREMGVKGLDGIKFTVPKDAFREPLYMKSRRNPDRMTVINKARIAVASNSVINIKDYNIWADTGGNHHMAIYIDENGKIRGEVVSLWEAYNRKKKGLPVFKTDFGPNTEFIMNLQTNDMFILENIPEHFNAFDKNSYSIVFDIVYRIQKMDRNCFIVSRKHNTTVSSDTDNTGVLRKNNKTLIALKIKVDELGFIHL